MDGVAESGPVCSPSDASHFQNLNGALGSLAEVESMSAVGSSPYTMLLGLGANGTAGVKSTTGPTSHWPQILSGEGGPGGHRSRHPGQLVRQQRRGRLHSPLLADDPVYSFGFWLHAPGIQRRRERRRFHHGVAGSLCRRPAGPVSTPVGTCRIWRGPANGSGWTIANAISPMFDGNRTSPSCNGNALVRSLAAMPLAAGGEIVYAGTYGALEGGATCPDMFSPPP